MLHNPFAFDTRKLIGVARNILGNALGINRARNCSIAVAY